MKSNIEAPRSAFSAFGGLRAAEVGAVRAVWRSVERYPAGSSLYCDGDSGAKNLIILSGWACEMRILADGRRQIFSFLLPGDPFEIRPFANLGSRGLVALTRLELVDPATLARADWAAPEGVEKAMQEAKFQQEDWLFDHMVRLGRLTAKERILNLLLELYDRLDAVGLVKTDSYRLPLTQEVFADALGLSIVHINRTLQELRGEGSIHLKAGTITLNNRRRLAAIACYQPVNDRGSGRRDLVA